MMVTEGGGEPNCYTPAASIHFGSNQNQQTKNVLLWINCTKALNSFTHESHPKFAWRMGDFCFFLRELLFFATSSNFHFGKP